RDAVGPRYEIEVATGRVRYVPEGSDARPPVHLPQRNGLLVVASAIASTLPMALCAILLTALFAAPIAAYRDISDTHGSLAAAIQNGSEESGTSPATLTAENREEPGTLPATAPAEKHDEPRILPATLPAEKLNVSGGPGTLPATAAAGTQELPKADALRELLDENSGPVAASMKAADESAATLLDSARQWKSAGEDIKREFEVSVKTQVDETGKTLEEEHGGVKQEADEKPKRVLEELRQKHAASSPSGAGSHNGSVGEE
ncbi:unnamed protein product, partial [Prorocentrum cordatum]